MLLHKVYFFTLPKKLEHCVYLGCVWLSVHVGVCVHLYVGLYPFVFRFGERQV